MRLLYSWSRIVGKAATATNTRCRLSNKETATFGPFASIRIDVMIIMLHSDGDLNCCDGVFEVSCVSKCPSSFNADQTLFLLLLTTIARNDR